MAKRRIVRDDIHAARRSSRTKLAATVIGIERNQLALGASWKTIPPTPS